MGKAAADDISHQSSTLSVADGVPSGIQPYDQLFYVVAGTMLIGCDDEDLRR